MPSCTPFCHFIGQTYASATRLILQPDHLEASTKLAKYVDGVYQTATVKVTLLFIAYALGQFQCT